MRLSLACNNRCLFCAQDGLAQTSDPTREEVFAALARGRQQSSEVTLTGGEPTLATDLEQIICHARELGFTRVGLQTNGRLLGQAKVLDKLVAAGLTDLHLSLHGPNAAVHDYHTGVEGSFTALVATLGLAATRKLPTVVVTVLTRSNARVLAGIPRLLQQHRVSAWLIRVPRVAGRAGSRFDALVPRLAMAIPSALHALSIAQRQRLNTILDGTPLCLLGPYAHLAIAGDGAGSYPTSCGDCSVRARCPGFDPHYLARFHGDEASVRQAPPAVQDLNVPAHVLRMLVGVGELASAQGVLRAETRREARHALPVLS
ncbi:MAG: radical SAM protein [Nannocystaceae bacterium]